MTEKLEESRKWAAAAAGAGVWWFQGCLRVRRVDKIGRTGQRNWDMVCSRWAMAISRVSDGGAWWVCVCAQVWAAGKRSTDEGPWTGGAQAPRRAMAGADGLCPNLRRELGALEGAG